MFCLKFWQFGRSIWQFRRPNLQFCRPNLQLTWVHQILADHSCNFSTYTKFWPRMTWNFTFLLNWNFHQTILCLPLVTYQINACGGTSNCTSLFIVMSKCIAYSTHFISSTDLKARDRNRLSIQICRHLTTLSWNQMMVNLTPGNIYHHSQRQVAARSKKFIKTRQNSPSKP